MESYLVFYILAGVLLVIEAFTPGTFLFICFAFGVAVMGLCDQFTNFNFTYLMAVNLGASLMALLLLRPFLKLIIKSPAQLDPKNYGSYPEKLINREAMVFKAIVGHEMGLVKLYDFDETWLAKSASGKDIGQGSTVVIKGMEANHLLVDLAPSPGLN
jgi:membrane protein implicated in regulation of membrane protease activity